MKSQLITVAQAASQKGVSRSAIYKAIATGRLQSERVLGKVALRQSDVADWSPLASKGRRKGTPMSQEAKRKISEGQKRRWKLRRSN